MEGGFFIPVNRHTSHSGHNYQFFGHFGAQGHTDFDDHSENILRELRKEFYSTGDGPVKSRSY